MSRRCPICGRPYQFRVPTRRAQDATLSRHYRHTANGWTYLHEIVLDFAGMGTSAAEMAAHE